MLNLNRYERLAAEAIRAAAEGAAVVQFDEELILGPTRADIDAMTDADLLETRALFASTTTGRDLLRLQGFSEQEIAALAAKHEGASAKEAAPQSATSSTPAAAVIARPTAKAVHTAPIAAPTTSTALLALNTPPAWRAEYERSPDLQREFASVDLYVTYMQGTKDGRIRRFGGSVK